MVKKLDILTSITVRYEPNELCLSTIKKNKKHKRPANKYFWKFNMSPEVPHLGIYSILFQITSVWKSPTPFMLLSMYMKKKSPLSPFISHALLKIAETGVKNHFSKRHVISEPNCKPLRKEGRSLGMPFLMSIFLGYSVCCILSLITLLLEHVYKPENSTRSLKVLSESDILQIKIDDIVNRLKSSPYRDNIFLRNKLTILLNELKTFTE